MRDRELRSAVDRVVSGNDFSGAARITRGDEVLFERANGYADRAREAPNRTTTRFGIASGTKGFTALTIMSLIGEGSLALNTSIRSVIGDDLELIDPRVTIEQLLSHTSGIGDYIDEAEIEDINEFFLAVPVEQLADTRDYLAVLQGHPAKFEPGERFAYCDAGFVVLALVAEVVTSSAFRDLAEERVFEPAGMKRTAFTRSDELAASDAIGYVPTDDGWRTNRSNLPVRGSGDGGAYSTLDDLTQFWRALFAGEILPRAVVEEVTRPRNEVPEESKRYGLGFWIRDDRDTVMLEGYDAGVSFRSAYDPASEVSYIVMSNMSEGAWPLVELLDGLPPDLA